MKAVTKLMFGCMLFMPLGTVAFTQQDDDQFNVLVGDLQCLILNLEEYELRPGEVIIIDLRTCPPASSVNGDQTHRNERPSLNVDAEIEFDKLLTLRRTELECLRDVQLNLSKRTAVFFPAQCNVIYD